MGLFVYLLICLFVCFYAFESRMYIHVQVFSFSLLNIGHECYRNGHFVGHFFQLRQCHESTTASGADPYNYVNIN